MSDRLQAIAAIERVERRVFAALAAAPVRRMCHPEERQEVRSLLERSLGTDRIPAPVLRVEAAGSRRLDGCSLQLLRGESWERTALSAHLFCPDAPPPWPVVLICCGHARHGKTGYDAMGLRLARQGAAALIPDNIGQGERVAMGHSCVTAAFAAGISVQGLIVRETLAWLDWLRGDQRFTRLGTAGNSGGGTLTMCLGALSDKLEAMASTGYPSSFELIARKQKKHCHCNLFPGSLGRYEMWELYALFAPRPLLLLQGANDVLFLRDTFLATARRVRDVYGAMGAGPDFSSAVPPGEHSWDAGRRALIGAFFARYFGLRLPEPDDEAQADLLTTEFGQCLEQWPANACDTDTLAWKLTGLAPRPAPPLWEVYPPEIPPPWPEVSERGATEQILAQMACFLSPLRSPVESGPEQP